MLMAALPFYDSAALVVGGVGIAPFYVVMGAFLVAHCPEILRWRPQPGDGLLVAFWVVCGVITAAGPLLFRGVEVFSSDLGLDEQVGYLQTLDFQLSNVAQLGYLALNLLLVGLLYRSADPVRLVHIAFSVGTLVALTSLIGATWPHSFFDTIPGGFYALTDYRPRGQFSEPSHLGLFALAAFTFYALMTLLHTGQKPGRLTCATLTAVSALLIIRSESGTAVGGAAIAAVVVITIGAVKVFAGAKVPPLTMLLGMVATGALVVVSPLIIGYGNDVLASKSGSVSQSNRSFADDHAYELFWQSHGLGLGLGSNRASSLFALLVSTIGVVGTGLFAVIAVVALRAALRSAATFPLAGALIAALAAGVVSGGSFSSPLFWVLIGSAGSARYGFRQSQPERLLAMTHSPPETG